MIDDRGPVVYQALLIHRLIELRRGNGLTQEKVARALEWSHAKLMRYEGGTQVLPKAELDALLRLYGVDDSLRGRELQEIGRRARDKPWWYPHRHALTTEERRYVGLEMGAGRIRRYCTHLLPELLQTRDYARAVCPSPDQAGRWVDVQIGRQGVLFTRNPAPEQVYVLDEVTLRYLIGGREVMVRQLHHLVERSASVELRIVPLRSQMHYLLAQQVHNLTLFDFDDGLPPVLYTQHLGRLRVWPEEKDVHSYAEAFDRLIGEHALDADQSRALVEHRIAELRTR